MTTTTTAPVVTPTPTPVVTAPVAPTPVTKPVEKKEKELSEAMVVHKKIEEVLKKFKGLESTIPLNHEYWGLLNQYRRLKSEE